jgi:hypothetical protein
VTLALEALSLRPGSASPRLSVTALTQGIKSISQSRFSRHPRRRRARRAAVGVLAIRQDWRRRRICWYIFSGCGREGATDGQRAEAKRKGSEEAEGEQAKDFGVRLQKIGHSERP